MAYLEALDMSPTGSKKCDVSFVRRPARAVYAAIAAVRIPKAPPALVVLILPVKSPAAKQKKVTVKKPNNDIKATDDFRLARKKMKVTIPHAER